MLIPRRFLFSNWPPLSFLFLLSGPLDYLILESLSVSVRIGSWSLWPSLKLSPHLLQVVILPACLPATLVADTKTKGYKDNKTAKDNDSELKNSGCCCWYRVWFADWSWRLGDLPVF